MDRLSVRVAHHHGPQEHHQVGLLAAAVSLLNRLPNPARRPGPAPCRRCPSRSSCSRPPSTTMPPSSTSTLVSIARLLVIRPSLDNTDSACDAAHLLEDHHLDGAVLADLRLDPQRQADVLALDGLERIDRAACRSCVGVLSRSGTARSADDDLGFFVVQRQQVGRGQDVAVAVGLQEVGQETEHVDAVGTSGGTMPIFMPWLDRGAGGRGRTAARLMMFLPLPGEEVGAEKGR
jgi:hypothetical protein